MLANAIDSSGVASKEADFSHLYLRAIHVGAPEPTPGFKLSLSSIFIGFLISGLLHALVFAFYGVTDAVITKKPAPHQLTIELKTQLPNKNPAIDSEIVPASKRPDAGASNITPTDAIATPEVIPDNKTHNSAKKVEQPVKIQHLTIEELREITSQENPEPGTSETGITANVFSSVLRKKLHEEASKPVLQRVDAGPKTHTDPAGATIVDLGNGKCLRSSVPEAGKAQNWYMTSCGGKSESEQILQRVNQAVHGKLKFD